uniref:JmjC domain-containing protein n=1 Tax=Panagrolaimus davidi TaxID=227884 RepID=A0A914Q678_9BILA
MSSNSDGSDEEEKENSIDNASNSNDSKVLNEESDNGSNSTSTSSGESGARANTSAASGGSDNGSKNSTNMVTICQAIDVTTADMEKYTLVDFINKKILEESFNGEPFCKLRLPEAFVRKFVIDPEFIEENFKRLNVAVASVISTLDGIYVRKYERGSYKSTEAVASHVRDMSETNNGDWRELLSRDTMSAINEMSYVENVHYSYMQKVYDMDVRKELPAGWNLNSLKSLLTDLLEGQVIPGVTDSYSYIGEPLTYSLWHREDFMMASGSFLFPGSSFKIWIGIASEYRQILEDYVREHRPGCKGPFNHKDLMLDVEILEQLNIPYYIAVQEPGELVVTFPAGFHQVVNANLNWSEAVNFICFRWQHDARRQYIYCCEDMVHEYSDKPWQSISKALFDVEVDVERNVKEQLCLVKKVMAAKKTQLQSDHESIDVSANEEPPSVIRNLQDIVTVADSIIDVDTVCPSSTITEKETISTPIVRSKVMSDRKERNQKEKNGSAPAEHMEAAEPILNKLRQRMPKLNILSEKNLEEIQNRQQRRQRNRLYQSTFREKAKKKGTYKTAKTGKTSGKGIARVLADRIKNKKASIKTYEKHLQNHNLQVKILSEEKYINYQVKLETANKMLSQFVRRRDLEDCVRNALTTAKVLFDEGYVSYEVVRDFLDGRRSAHRDIIIKGMRRINKRDVDFWKTVVSSEEKWNEYFGVDERFRIPAREYNVSSESESSSNEMEEE